MMARNPGEVVCHTLLLNIPKYIIHVRLTLPRIKYYTVNITWNKE